MTTSPVVSISVVDYLPTPDLDGELADLGHAAVLGWPDQSPVTASVVRSALRATGTTATTLALYRDPDGILVGAVALRWPATLEAPGWLWGPVVHPSVRHGGLGERLLAAIEDVLATRPGVRVVTAEIPESRAQGWNLYERAGWHRVGAASLLTRALPAARLGRNDPAGGGITVRNARPGEYLDPDLARLYAGMRPDLGHATARDTYTRWTLDERYDPDGLLLAEDASGLAGAALVYPMTHNRYGEPYEALLADLITGTWLAPGPAQAVRAALVDSALLTGAALGAVRARAIVDDPDLVQTLLLAGFQVVDGVRYYGAPGPVGLAEA
jgi:GNAT superfamily N-acetyltransferase